MNLKGEYRGIAWIGFDRQRPGRRRELILKYADTPGQRLVVLASIVGGGASLEHRLHSLFAVDRAHGEWFRPTGPLRAFIRAVAA